MTHHIEVNLRQWERRWTDLGLPTRRLEVGSPKEEIVNRLTAEFGSPPPEDLVEWYRWQNGSLDEWVAAPTSHTLLSLKDAVLARRSSLAVNRTADPDEPGVTFGERWLPLMLSGSDMRVFDIDTGHVYAFDWWDPESPVEVSPELYALVANWCGILDLGLYAWNEASQTWDVDEDLMPERLRRLRLVD